MVVVGALAACSAPPPIRIPEQSEIGPAPPAALGCVPPILRFGQAPFWIADLDRGLACEQFLEQDECVVALFRDCTDAAASTPRSWQGSIDPMGTLTLTRTQEGASGGVTTRSPTHCEGPVTLEARSPERIAWASLSCTLPAGIHGGLYLEASRSSDDDPIPPFATLDPRQRAHVLGGLTGGQELRAFALRAGAQEIWAVLSGAGGSAPPGVYRGRPGGDLTRLEAPAIDAPTHLAVTRDGRTVFVAERARLFALTPEAGPAQTFEANGDVLDLAVVPDGLLVATREDDGRRVKSVVTLYDATTLAPRPELATVDGEIAELVPMKGMEGTGTSSIALVRFARATEVRFLHAPLTVGRSIPIGGEPRAVVVMPERRRVGFALRDDRGATYVEVALDAPASAPLPSQIRLPGMEIKAGVWDPLRARLIFAMRTGTLLEYDPEVRRPFLQSQVELPAVASSLAIDSSSTAFALFSTAGVVQALVRD